MKGKNERALIVHTKYDSCSIGKRYYSGIETNSKRNKNVLFLS